mmetsp:Transcript_2645/g.4894  ORF Transcript_2645/g.4894 Transcript_2645/m.4894 type:complete len:479 (-) Transcript_2645:384-1820(-)
MLQLQKADTCYVCGKRMGYINGYRGLGWREQGHEKRCSRRKALSSHSSILSKQSNRSGLDSIVYGCEMLRSFNLPPKALQLLAQIEASTQRLTSMVSTVVDESNPGIWTSPTSEEQWFWHRLQPEGGRLLHCQVCVVTYVPSEEWFMGRLFVSENGLAFFQDTELCIGLLKWCSIEDMECDKSVARIHVKQGLLASSCLRLHLGLAAECSRMRQAWTFYALATMSFLTGCDDSETADEDARQKCLAAYHRKAEAPFTPSFQVATRALPSRPNLADAIPLCSGHIPNATLDIVRKVLEKDDDWVLCRFQANVLHAHDITLTPWSQEQLTPRTAVRRVSFKLPAPDDIPKTLSNMIRFPKSMDSQLSARLICDVHEISLVMHSFSLNVPYGDHQRLEDVLVFTPDAYGGIRVSKFMKVVWLKSMPWALRAAEHLLESKVKQEGLSFFSHFMDLMQDECEELWHSMEDTCEEVSGSMQNEH